jgi:hypothetical protein
MALTVGKGMVNNVDQHGFHHMAVAALAELFTP